MTEISERLRKLREGRGFETAADAARAMGVPISTYIQNENGSRDPGKQRIQKYAEFYRSTPEWILYGRTTAPPPTAPPKRPRPVRTVPVFAWVAAGKLRDPDTQLEPTETIEISGLPAGDYFGTRVQGDSMDRLSPPGSLVLVNRAETELLRGRRYIFNHRGETTYKRWEPDPDRLEPESTNPANKPIFPRSQDDWSVIGRVRLTLLDDL